MSGIGLEEEIQAVTNFISAYEKQKYKVMREGGKLISPVCFMVDYCKYLRDKAKGEDK